MFLEGCQKAQLLNKREMAYWGMCPFMIHVYERTLDVRKDLQLILKALADIVCFVKGGIRVHYDIHFDKIILSKVSENGIFCIYKGSYWTTLRNAKNNY